MCGMPQESANAFEKCVELEPGSMVAMTKLASSYIKLDRTDEANKLLEEVVENEKSNGAARFLLALSLSKQRNLERAASECQAAIDLKFELSPVAESLLESIKSMQQYLSNKSS